MRNLSLNLNASFLKDHPDRADPPSADRFPNPCAEYRTIIFEKLLSACMAVK